MSTWTRFSTAISIMVVVSVSCRDAPTASERVPLLPRSSSEAIQAGLPFSEELAELGDEIFDDRNLSLRKNQACNTCHLAEWGFTGPDPAINAAGAVYAGSIPTRFGDRKPPSSAYSTLSPVLEYVRRAGGIFVGGSFWDGRATGERLGSAAADQAQGPFLNPMEQALPDAACVVYRVSIAPYAAEYVRLWGSQILTIAFPPNTDELCGVEGITVPLSSADRVKVNAEYANVAIAIAVYEQSHNLFSSKFDAARRGAYTFTPEEQRGFALFQGKGQCARCHVTSGQQPAFTDHEYDNLGVPANPQNPFYQTNPSFVDLGLGGFLQTRPEWASLAPLQMGKMRVPTLRNVDLRPYVGATKAYMHNGVFKSLEEVVRFYNTRDVLPECASGAPRAAWGVSCWPAAEVAQNVNRVALGKLNLTAEEEAAIVAFLRTLSDGFIDATAGRRSQHLTPR